MLHIRVPASTSNLGAGFDAFGLALKLYNDFYLYPSDCYKVEVEGYGQSLPRDENNLFIKAYIRACEAFGFYPEPIVVRQINHVPTARGLGSSATAIVGGIIACARLKGIKPDIESIMEIAFHFEPHPDNLLPALLGGLILCVSEEKKVSYLRLDFPQDIKVVLCVPDFELSTERARQVLKRDVPLKDAIFNLQRSALLVGALLNKKYELLKEATKDRLHQPYRAELIPGFYHVLESAYSYGALAVFLSGAGPSVAALCLEGWDEIGNAMMDAFSVHGIKAHYQVLEVSYEGAYS